MSSASYGAEKPVASYVVVKNDILGFISLKHYGTSRKWKKIARWNHIEDPHHIRPGQKLELFEMPTLSLSEGQRLVDAAKEKRRQMRAANGSSRQVAATPKSFDRAEPKKEIKKTPAQVANTTYKSGNYRAASALFSEERKKDPDRVTAWLYELSSLKLSGNVEKFLEIRKLFLEKFPTLAQLELVKVPSRGMASKAH